MTLRFPEHPDVQFDRAPLVEVLCQVKFPPILSLLTAAGVAGFQEALRSSYPVLAPEAGAEIELGPAGVTVSEKVPVWRVSTQDQSWRVSIATDFVAVECFHYTNVHEFLAKADDVLAVLERTIHPEASTRVGLRKINDFAHPEVHRPADWRGLLRAELLGVLDSTDIPDAVQLAFSELRLQEDEEILAIRHGALPGSMDKYRLDLDYYTERPFTIDAGGPLVEVLQRYSDAITSFFHWCLTERLYDWLGAHPREGGRVGDSNG